jgi:hypothetical protein
MIEIRNLYPTTAITQMDPAPKPASRNEPRDTPATKARAKFVQQERRNNPDRRKRRAKERLDQRTGADRRRHTLDIEV